MATSGRFSELHHPDELEDDLERGQGGDVPEVERGRDFVNVEPAEAHAAELAKKVEQLARGERAGRGDAGSGCDRWIERIDVERDVQRIAADSRADLVRELTARPAMRGGGGDQGDAHLSNELHLLPVVVPASQQCDFPGIDLSELEASPQGAAIRPPAMARGIIQVRVRVDIEDAHPSVKPALLRD